MAARWRQTEVCGGGASCGRSSHFHKVVLKRKLLLACCKRQSLRYMASSSPTSYSFVLVSPCSSWSAAKAKDLLVMNILGVGATVVVSLLRFLRSGVKGCRCDGWSYSRACR